ncbi:hypothetical protein V4D07_24730 [Paenibacillus taichungensis]
MNNTALYHKLREDLSGFNIRGIAKLNPIEDTFFLLDNEMIHTDGEVVKESTGIIVRTASYVIVEIKSEENARYDVYLSAPDYFQSVVQHILELCPKVAA